jgi:hypothetical protein
MKPLRASAHDKCRAAMAREAASAEISQGRDRAAIDECYLDECTE